MDVKDKKIIVNIQKQDLEKLERAAAIENRKRNNFVITAAIEKANNLIKRGVKS